MKKDIFGLYAEILKYPSDINKLSKYLFDLGIDESDGVKDYSLQRLQEIYVETFDFNEKTALFLSQHTAETAEEKSRIILAMSELLSEYEVRKTPNAQPDYLPDILKAFRAILKTSENKDAAMYLADILFETVSKIAEELNDAGNTYAEIMKHLRDDLAPFTSKQEVTYV